jgi:hypothetical protein
VDTRNSQKKSPRNSAKSEMNTAEVRSPQSGRKFINDPDDEEKYMDYSNDHVARVRAAKEAAQRQMESFGDVSEYDIRVIQGQFKEEPTAAPSQPSLAFESAIAPDVKEEIR